MMTSFRQKKEEQNAKKKHLQKGTGKEKTKNKIGSKPEKAVRQNLQNWQLRQCVWAEYWIADQSEYYRAQKRQHYQLKRDHLH